MAPKKELGCISRWSELTVAVQKRDFGSVINIFNSKGICVGVIMDNEIFGLEDQKRYDLKGSNIHK